jgi:hypothetical protein
MDKLAEKLGMDPVEFRLKNALKDGDTLGVGTPAPGPVTIVRVMEEAAKKFGWRESKVESQMFVLRRLSFVVAEDSRRDLKTWASVLAIRKTAGPKWKFTGTVRSKK